MKLLRKRLYIYTGAAALGMFVIVPMLIMGGGSGQNAAIMLLLGVTITIHFAVFSVLEYKRLKAARLIIENQILHICHAVIESGEPGVEAAAYPAESIEVFISCFGILLDSRVIKFNQKNIYLKSVEIGQNYISLTYGTANETQSTRLLHGTIDSSDIADIVEKFRYETGIIPTIVKECPLQRKNEDESERGD